MYSVSKCIIVLSLGHRCSILSTFVTTGLSATSRARGSRNCRARWCWTTACCRSFTTLGTRRQSGTSAAIPHARPHTMLFSRRPKGSWLSLLTGARLVCRPSKLESGGIPRTGSTSTKAGALYLKTALMVSGGRINPGSPRILLRRAMRRYRCWLGRTNFIKSSPQLSRGQLNETIGTNLLRRKSNGTRKKGANRLLSSAQRVRKSCGTRGRSMQAERPSKVGQLLANA